MCNFVNAFLWAVLTTAIRQTLSHVTLATSTVRAKKAELVEAVIQAYH